MLQRGDQVPHFTARTLDGRAVSYAALWQEKNLVLIVLSATGDESAGGDAARLIARLSELDERDTETIVTRDSVEKMPAPGALVADRWGEIAHVWRELPDPRELFDWLEYVRSRCPECEGESK